MKNSNHFKSLVVIVFFASSLTVVWSCSSKSAQIRPTATPQRDDAKTSAVASQEQEGVWKPAEGDRSVYLSSSRHHHQEEEVEEEESASPAAPNGHNDNDDEGLVLKSLPTQEEEDTSSGQRKKPVGSESPDDDYENSNSFHSVLSPTNANNAANANNNNRHSQYHQFHRKHKPLTLAHFGNKSIQCNDGTTAGYYTRTSTAKNSNTWIIFLEGGWFCFDERSCQNRWLRLKNLMSSSHWSYYKHVGGILSPDSNENPYWWNANHVFVPYCSSDTWSGTAKAEENGSRFTFMGSLIVEEVVKSLIRAGGLRRDSVVILAGSSAGGTGVLINLDRVEGLLNEKFGSARDVPRVRGISDSGWFIDKLPAFLEKVDCHDAILCPPEISLKKGVKLWKARLPEKCEKLYAEEPWSCFYGYKIYPTMKASLFVFQWMFDEAQMLVNNVPTPALKKEEWDYVYKVGDELKKSLANVTNVFIPACMSHTVLTHPNWKRVEVNSVGLPRALKCWESGGIAGDSNSISSSLPSNSFWDEYDRSDSSRGFNRNSKLRNGGGGGGGDVKLQNSPMEQSDFPDFIHTNDSRRNRRRHNNHYHRQRQAKREERRRQRRKMMEQERLMANGQSRGSTQGDWGYLTSRDNLSNIVRTRQRRRHNEKHLSLPTPDQSLLKTKGHNADGSLNRRGGGVNSKSSSNNDNFDNRVPRKRNRRRNLDVPRDNFATSSNHLRNRRRQRRRRWYSVCEADGESGMSSNGDIRLIEKCSWPQCNKSCPKLLNPLTGEEVDFKDLLKSFGLDMATMAKALGIDLVTLNNMDHQVLLQMLTQHA